jgi:hypothetical protein
MLLKERKFSIYRWKNNFVLSNTAFKEKRKSAMEVGVCHKLQYGIV